MQENGFLDHAPQKVTAGDVLGAKNFPALIAIGAHEWALEALWLMQQHGVSQLPVVEDGRVTGSLNEVTLIKLLHDGVDLKSKCIFEVMGRPLPQVDESIDISEAYRLLLAGHGGVIVTRDGAARGFLARIDLANFWAAPPEERVPAMAA